MTVFDAEASEKARSPKPQPAFTSGRRTGRKFRATRKWRRKPLYSCSRSFVVVRPRTVCVGQTVRYHPLMFALVRLEPPILLRQRCDRANRRGTNGDGFWGRTDTRRAAAYSSYNRDFAASRGALSGARPALQGAGGAGLTERRQDVGSGLPHSRDRQDAAPSLGRTSDVGLEQARERANELTSAARGGRDLIGEEGEARDAAASRITVASLIDLYLRRRVLGRLRTAKTIESRLRRTLTPILQQYAADICRRDIRELLDDIVDLGKGREAEKRRQVCTAMFRWALSQDCRGGPDRGARGVRPWNSARSGVDRRRNRGPVEVVGHRCALS